MFKKSTIVLSAAIMLPFGVLAATPNAASATPSPVAIYDSSTNPLVPMVSEAFQATSTSEFGNEISFAVGPRVLSGATVTLDSWACQSGGWADQANDCVTAPGTTFSEPVTLNLYAVGPGNSVGALLSTTTQTFNIPDRPSDTPSCSSPGNGEFLASNGKCAHGLPVNISFDLGNVAVPDAVIYGISYNTSGHGPDPYGYATECAQTPEGCGYDSLNVALSSTQAPSVGTDPLPGSDFLSSTWNGAYCDNGANGTGSFRWDSVTQATGGSPAYLGCVANTDSAAGNPDPSNNNDYYIPAVQFDAPAPPNITGITPSSGPTTGGTSVSITGTNFTGAAAVAFGTTVAASYNVVSDTQITAVTPAGTAGTDAVSVTTPSGTATDNGAFTYLCQTPIFTSANSDTVVAGQPMTPFLVTTCGNPALVIKGSHLPVGIRPFARGVGQTTISGTPGSGLHGVYVATLTASLAGQIVATQSFALTVDNASKFNSLAKFRATAGTAFSAPVTTKNAFPIPSITTVSTLPSGVTLVDNHDGTATLGGTPGPATGGVYAITITATNSVAAVKQAFTLTIGQSPQFTGPAAATAQAGVAMAPFTVATGGYPSPTLHAVGLPSGVNLTGGTIAGTPKTSGNYDVTITAHNSAGTVSEPFTLTVTP